MNGVPGVMTLLSHVFLMTCSPISWSPCDRSFEPNCLINSSFFSSASFASWAARNRRDRCWFIFARGATPSVCLLVVFLRTWMEKELHSPWRLGNISRCSRPRGDRNVPAATFKHTNCDQQNLTRPRHIHHPVCVFEDLEHHLRLVCRRRLSFGMRTWMYDTVEVEVQIIRLFAIGVRLGCVDRDFLTVNFVGLLFDNGRDDLRVLLLKPSEKGWDTHFGRVEGFSLDEMKKCDAPSHF